MTTENKSEDDDATIARSSSNGSDNSTPIVDLKALFPSLFDKPLNLKVTPWSSAIARGIRPASCFLQPILSIPKKPFSGMAVVEVGVTPFQTTEKGTAPIPACSLLEIRQEDNNHSFNAITTATTSPQLSSSPPSTATPGALSGPHEIQPDEEGNASGGLVHHSDNESKALSSSPLSRTTNAFASNQVESNEQKTTPLVTEQANNEVQQGLSLPVVSESFDQSAITIEEETELLIGENGLNKEEEQQQQQQATVHIDQDTSVQPAQVPELLPNSHPHESTVHKASQEQQEEAQQHQQQQQQPQSSVQLSFQRFLGQTENIDDLITKEDMPATLSKHKKTGEEAIQHGVVSIQTTTLTPLIGQALRTDHDDEISSVRNGTVMEEGQPIRENEAKKPLPKDESAVLLTAPSPPAINVSTPQTPRKRPSKLPVPRKSTSTPTHGFLTKVDEKKGSEATTDVTPLQTEPTAVGPTSPSVSRTRHDIKGSKVPIRKESRGSSQSPVRKVARASSLTRTANAAAAAAAASTKTTTTSTTSSMAVNGRSKMREGDIPMNHRSKDDEDEERMPRPISLKEKRERQAKREEQVKLWRVREEREAREARSAARRLQMGQRRSVTAMKDVQQGEKQVVSAATKKGVKFNLKRNRVIEITAKPVDT
ncbi:hypothetical protein EC973_003104 [Apophysomyces ossiformis]|uniref:Uncharacterized protein n=1 Tax=Apophysomyces ossiformis TaxID=679940 RepID=A0A8H7BMV1_9FUNG|nr:hypothetical protein EC973_003104 [Apophysomyces ossiformis]